jgi:hypothetical protein
MDNSSLKIEQVEPEAIMRRRWNRRRTSALQSIANGVEWENEMIWRFDLQLIISNRKIKNY